MRQKEGHTWDRRGAERGRGSRLANISMRPPGVAGSGFNGLGCRPWRGDKLAGRQKSFRKVHFACARAAQQKSPRLVCGPAANALFTGSKLRCIAMSDRCSIALAHSNNWWRIDRPAGPSQKARATEGVSLWLSQRTGSWGAMGVPTPPQVPCTWP